jgi:hypothetical protein
MSIQPIDLQTLFAHLNHVGKDQAVQKEAAVLQQQAKGTELVKETRHRDESVNETEEMEDETGKIDDEKQEGSRSGPGGKHSKEQEKAEEKTRNVYEDPDIGKNIDITG